MANFQPNVLNAINAAAQRYGIDPQVLIRIAQIESGGNPNAKENKRSMNAEIIYRLESAYSANEKGEVTAS